MRDCPHWWMVVECSIANCNMHACPFLLSRSLLLPHPSQNKKECNIISSWGIAFIIMNDLQQHDSVTHTIFGREENKLHGYTHFTAMLQKKNQSTAKVSGESFSPTAYLLMKCHPNHPTSAWVWPAAEHRWYLANSHPALFDQQQSKFHYAAPIPMIDVPIPIWPVRFMKSR